MFLQTCLRYTRDSSEKSNQYTWHTTAKVGEHETAECFGGELQKAPNGQDGKRLCVKEKAEELRAILYSENYVKNTNRLQTKTEQDYFRSKQ